MLVIFCLGLCVYVRVGVHCVALLLWFCVDEKECWLHDCKDGSSFWHHDRGVFCVLKCWIGVAMEKIFHALHLVSATRTTIPSLLEQAVPKKYDRLCATFSSQGFVLEHTS